ncbi:hypothetical protein G6O69_33775 [Pseudenhygromyxa sp. WMMC2535]|uniref:hypothetical protein n=1 Tax=Pseudenhygromyxa sp. WMMC2535 TaxID=2712867 RepID=UPI001553F4DF|nr:hypothetical protein [Pseudenhygromyxa sp. WMMC2535]NVB42839.1 hypothetical protein [Pseudenhygromyxa sp. WMMC2535]
MNRLTPCPSCKNHVLISERECPHCGSALRTASHNPALPLIVMGLTLAACPVVAEPEYGVPDTTTAESGSETVDSGDAETTTETTTDTTTTGESEYGVPDTGETTSATDDSESTGEPEYGVSETDSGESDTFGEPEYGVAETDSGESGALGLAEIDSASDTDGEPEYGVPNSGW